MSLKNDIEGIPARLEAVRRRIDESARRAGRADGSVRLIAVSKGKPMEAIRAAYAAGQRDFGENYVQELADKTQALHDLEGLRWHSIGRLQRNKAKQVVQLARVIHAVDREELATELGRRATASGLSLDVLIEINISSEVSKGGCAPDALGGLLSVMRRTDGLRVVGLMTIPPVAEDPEAIRPMFTELRALREQHGGAAALPELSMGMTHDYEIAIEEGATMVRVGTAIFGAR